MALTFDIPERDAITLPECITLITQIEDIHDESQPNIEKMADILKCLSNNKKFLVDLLERDLKDLPSMNQFQKDSPFPQQVISLGGGPGFWLRANIWPVTHKCQPKAWERNLFAYLKPHDHNALHKVHHLSRREGHAGQALHVPEIQDLGFVGGRPRVG